ncbi:hypothetical protein F2Q69_00048448 [Brassica cretica]|uniref:Uncharacterized protein n=1 Tax=Brassica cretica TaxID=69181 RepID=A0A8S9PNE5_BRACR|nr:hypothetical protein F2Q69_00048448 [Brassica cretica]
MLKWINLSTIHTCLDCLKEPKLTSNAKPDITACLGAWYTWDRILQTSLEGLGGGNLQGSLHKEFLDIGQKEVNKAWWQPPLRLDSWKPVQSWYVLRFKSILESSDDYGAFRSLNEYSSELTIRGRYEEDTIDRCTSSVVDRYRRDASMIKD